MKRKDVLSESQLGQKVKAARKVLCDFSAQKVKAGGVTMI